MTGSATFCISETRDEVVLLPVKSRDEHRFAQHVAVHGVDDRGASCRGILRRALRDVELRVERVELKRVVMVRAGRSAGTHVRI